MDAHLDPTSRDYDGQRISTLANAVFFRLMTPLGSWWADPTLGSRLHELQREKDLERFYTLARQYSEQALKPLLDDGRAQQITVSASRFDQVGWCLLLIDVTDSSGQVSRFQHVVRVA